MKLTKIIIKLRAAVAAFCDLTKFEIYEVAEITSYKIGTNLLCDFKAFQPKLNF